MLSPLISKANSLGWSISLHQHPDRLTHWECSLSRRVEPSPTEYITREVATGFSSHSPETALVNALNAAETQPTCQQIPQGRGALTLIQHQPRVNLLDLLGLNKPAAPIITRRI